jgi:transposase
MLGVHGTVVEGVELDQNDTVLVVHVRPMKGHAGRCSRCGAKRPGYDQGGGARRWRSPDLGTLTVYLEAPAPRVTCPEHGVVVAAVPWARPAAGFTRDFEQTCTWLVKHMPKSRVAEFLRISWRAVDAIVTRVVTDAADGVDRLARLRRIGIDEISHRKGHHYLTTVVDHATGRVVWAAEGRNTETLGKFFDLLGEKRSRQLQVISADAADWITSVVEARAPQAKRCLDPFHVVMWVTDALDTVRRETVNALKAAGRHDEAATLKGTRWALLKNPLNQTGAQRTTVASIRKTNDVIYRSYLLKEQMREVFFVGGDKGRKLLAGWLAWAKRSRIEAFVKVATTVEKQRQAIWNTLEFMVSNARVEATNTHLRNLMRRAYGFRSIDALIAMALLTRGGLAINLPGRTT